MDRRHHRQLVSDPTGERRGNPRRREWRHGAGPSNLPGARALYISQNGEDTFYRIHGSSKWWSIGKAVSSGCLWMINHDVVELYARVPDRATIMVASLPRRAVV
ncbi:L,D-transpeptidase [Agrobacterium sp. P15N1-A]|uniref:L,D-transpeptidase n=1 Tax=Agrobacterium sp. P15N1-A TaxID=3342820 RepID=UPI0037DC10EF